MSDNQDQNIFDHRKLNEMEEEYIVKHVKPPDMISDSSEFKMYEKRLLRWSKITKLSKQEQVDLILSSIASSNPLCEILDTDIDDSTDSSTEGVNLILSKMKEFFGYGEEMYNCFKEFENKSRNLHSDLIQFLDEWENLYKKCKDKNITLSERALGLKLLKACNLHKQDQILVLRETGILDKLNSYERTKRSILNLYKSGCLKLSDTEEIGIGPRFLKDASHANDNLHFAARKGDSQWCEWLLTRGANVNKRDSFGATPLYWAAWKGQKETFKLLIENNADIHLEDEMGETALYWATRNGHYTIAKQLCELGAKATVKETSNKSILGTPCKDGNLKLVKLLLTQDADVNFVEKDGKTPLFWAASNGHYDTVKILCNSGANAHVSDKKGHSTLTTPCKDGNLQIVKLLLKCGADPSGGACLHIALDLYHQDIVETLLKEGSDVDKIVLYKNQRLTPLMVAAKTNSEEALRWLLNKDILESKYNADPNIFDEKILLPLHMLSSPKISQ